ncbi:MAG: 50S ribosomal protein L10 [Armatimonadota bacterium]
MRKDEKEQVVAELVEELAGAGSLIISGYRGLTVKELTELRRGIAGFGAHTRVVKKTLLLRALSGRDEERVGEHMDGPVAVTFVSGDPMPVLKSMSAFAKTHAALEFKGGWIERRAVNGKQVLEMSALPAREELLARLLASMQGPLVNLVMTLQAVPRDLVLTLQALVEKRGGVAATGEAEAVA